MTITSGTLGYELHTHPDGWQFWRHASTGRVLPYIAGGADDGGDGDGQADTGSTDTGTGDDQTDSSSSTDDNAGDGNDDRSTTDPDRLQADVDKWRALARKHEKQAKDNADAAKRLAEIEDADKSALDKATETLAAESARADKAEQKLMRYEAAVKAGLDAKHIHRLHGDTEDELLADAKALKAELQPKVNGDADGGARGGDDKKKPASLEDAVTAALAK